jgi:ATP-dependent Clp endopeptidase proteolytic subunit ClpP
MRPCFAFTNIAAASETVAADLDIFDEIGFWGVQAKDFKDSLDKLVKAGTKTVNVAINSPGGDVFAGLAIFNSLRASGMEIVVKVMGVAASAASLIAMAGDKIVMPKNTFMMIHNPWSFAVGNADELRETADVLDKIGGSLKATYAKRTGLSDAEVADMLAKDTWLTADEALEKGFADEVTDDIKANARFDMARADLPENVKAVFLAAGGKTKATTEQTAEQTEDNPVEGETFTAQVTALAKAAGMEQYAAAFALAFDGDLAAVKTRIGEAREIQALCVVAEQVPYAKTAIEAGTSLKDVRAHLVKVRAEADEKTHTNGSKPTNSKDTGTGGNPPVVNTQTIWDSHNRNNSRQAK